MDKTRKLGLLQTIQQQLIHHKNSKHISKELRQALDECSTVEQVKELLFALDYKDGATLKAFDKKLEELDYTP